MPKQKGRALSLPIIEEKPDAELVLNDLPDEVPKEAPARKVEDSFLACRGDKVLYRKRNQDGVVWKSGIAWITMVIRPTGYPGDCVFNFIGRDMETEREVYLADYDFVVIEWYPRGQPKPFRFDVPPDDDDAKLFKQSAGRDG